MNPIVFEARRPKVVPIEARRRRVSDEAAAAVSARSADVSGVLANVVALPRADRMALWQDPDAADAADAADATDAPADEAGPVVFDPPPTAHRDVVAEPDDAALAALIQRIVERDEKALEALYDATSARVYGLVMRIMRRAALAEEVVEDTYWQVWRQAPRFDAARGRPVTWLLAMARSRAIDALRRDERFRHEELPEDDAAEDDGDTPPPQDLLDATRGAAALHAALAALEPKARQLVTLAFFRGLTHEEIARREAMPLGSVKSLIRRALLQLRRALEAADDNPRAANFGRSR